MLRFLRRLFGIHQHVWSKWSRVDVTTHLLDGTVLPGQRQSRTCEECGWQDLQPLDF